MTEVLDVAAIWLLSAMLFGWLFGRAARRLRQPPPSVAELRLAMHAYSEEHGLSRPTALDTHAFWRAVHVYDSA
jgi:hypothetical protein